MPLHAPTAWALGWQLPQSRIVRVGRMRNDKTFESFGHHARVGLYGGRGVGAER